jgi:transcriptional regulator with XRE-family HTH domain
VRIESRLRDHREALRKRFGTTYSLIAVAQRAGIAERSLAGYEAGEREPSVTVALALARELGVTVEQLGFRRVDDAQHVAPAAR